MAIAFSENNAREVATDVSTLQWLMLMDLLIKNIRIIIDVNLICGECKQSVINLYREVSWTTHS